MQTDSLQAGKPVVLHKVEENVKAKKNTFGKKYTNFMNANANPKNVQYGTVFPHVGQTNTPKPQIRRENHPGHADAYTRMCAEMKTLKKEFADLKKSIHANPTIITRNPSTKPISWYCTYNYDKDPATSRVNESLNNTVPYYSVLPIDKMRQLTQLGDTNTIPGFVTLHRSDLSIEEQGKNTENILYAGLLHFTIPCEAQESIQHSITDGILPTELCEKHVEFDKAKNAAFVLCRELEDKQLNPTCWCTGANGFCVIWHDPVCFLRFKKHKVVQWSRCVDIFMETYLSQDTLDVIRGKFDLWNGVLNTQHAVLCTYHCRTSPTETKIHNNIDMQTNMPHITKQMILATRIITFWNFLLTNIPVIRKMVVRLPLAPIPKDPMDVTIPTETSTKVPTETSTKVPTETSTKVPTETSTEFHTETAMEVPTEIRTIDVDAVTSK